MTEKSILLCQNKILMGLPLKYNLEEFISIIKTGN